MAYTDSGDRNGSTKDESMHPEIISGDNAQVLLVVGDHPERGGAHKLSSSSYPKCEGEARKSSSSCSSDSSSSEDFFQLDASDLSKPRPSATEAASNDLIFPIVKNDLQLLPLITTEEVETTPLRISPLVPDVGALGNSALIDVSQPPPVQEMVRSDVPDPYRIPSSVFARTKSNAPMEWSVASNESLFSIHMGNSSFSRDQFILLGKPGEQAASPPLPPEPEDNHGPALTPEEVNAEAMKDVLRAAADGRAEREKPPVQNVPLHCSASRRSNGSTTSINSFAFPILTAEVRSGSVRVLPDKQNHAPKTEVNGEIQNVEGTPKAAQGSWCTCFPCSFCR